MRAGERTQRIELLGRNSLDSISRFNSADPAISKPYQKNMHFLKRENRNDPSFVLLETALPADRVSSFLLGIVARDMANPTHEFRPRTPDVVNREYVFEIEDSDYSTFLQDNKQRTLETNLGHLFGVSSENVTESSEGITSTFVRTRALIQHRDTKDALLKSSHRAEIIDLLQHNQGKGYLAVAFKTSVSGQRSKRFESKKRVTMSLEAPVGTAVTGISHGTMNLPAGSVDPKLVFKDDSGHTIEASSKQVKEQIFAVQYRVLALKRRWNRKHEDSVETGQIMRLRYGSAVFGSRRENGSPIVDEDDPLEDDRENEVGEESDDDIVMLDETMEEEAEKTDQKMVLVI